MLTETSSNLTQLWQSFSFPDYFHIFYLNWFPDNFNLGPSIQYHNIHLVTFFRSQLVQIRLLMLSLWFACKRINVFSFFLLRPNKSQVLDFRTASQISWGRQFYQSYSRWIVHLWPNSTHTNARIHENFIYSHLSKYQCVIDFWYNETGFQFDVSQYRLKHSDHCLPKQLSVALCQSFSLQHKKESSLNEQSLFMALESFLLQNWTLIGFYSNTLIWCENLTKALEENEKALQSIFHTQKSSSFFFFIFDSILVEWSCHKDYEKYKNQCFSSHLKRDRTFWI